MSLSHIYVSGRAVRRVAAPVLLAGAALALSGCDMVVMNPTGDVAVQQRDLILIATALMLVIIVPVMVLTALFAWRYRAGAGAKYTPNWDHSTLLELVIWSCPLLIIIALGAITWSSTHLLDPFRPIERIAPGKPVPAGAEPLDVQVVAMDWKWLFIYPKLGIATVNELAVPVNVPLRFSTTSTDQMNTFYAPTLAGMIYSMPGMETPMNAVLNKVGESEGYSGNYSGAGYSEMRFKLHGLTQGGFDRWVADVKRGGQMSAATFMRLERPSEKVPIMHFGQVQPGLYERVVNRCVEPGKPCASDVMRRDMHMGGGTPGSVEAGHGNPSANEGDSMHGEKPTPALLKKPEEKGNGENRDVKPAPAPGQLDPGNQRNRSLSAVTPLPAPGAPRAAAA